MRRLLSAVFVLAACAVAFVLAGASADSTKALKEYDIVVDNAFGLVEGGDLKIGGVKAGKIKSFRLTKPDPSEPYRTIVAAEVTEPGFDSLRTDAKCDIRAQSLIGEYFIDCDLGTDKQTLPDGGVVPVKNTSSTIPPDLINNVMRRPYRERFRLILSELGTGLAGRPEDLNDVIRRAHPGLRELTETLAILRSQNKIISDFIRDADTVSRAVEPFKEDVARWARESQDTAAIQATRSDELGRYYERLPDFLEELEPTLGQLERTANSQIPTLRTLQAAAPDLERFLIAAQPFARNSRGSLRALGRASVAGSAAFEESAEEIEQLRRLARLAPRLGKPLRQFLQSIDDRRRSIENDPGAGVVAPPAPDKTAYKKGQGFTGMEAFWNYVTYQTLAINSFDELGHLLRIVTIAGGPCAPYTASPTQDEIQKCNSWLGPSQTGVTGPEPAAPAEASVGTSGSGGSGTARAPSKPGGGARQGAPGSGQSPPPLEPRSLIPPELERLLDDLPTPKRTPALPGGERGLGGDPTKILDYLLAP